MEGGRAIRSAIEGFRSLGIPFLVGGSFASSAWGIPRYTQDLDLSVQISESQVDAILATFGADFMVSREEIHTALFESSPYRSFQLLHFDEVFKVDVFIVQDTPFARSEYARAVELEVFPGVLAPTASAEDTILRKLDWFRLGNRVSDRQWNDVCQVVFARGENLDVAYLRRWAEELGLLDLLEEALRQVGPIDG